jgi:hypothetical protein
MDYICTTPNPHTHGSIIVHLVVVAVVVATNVISLLWLVRVVSSFVTSLHHCASPAPFLLYFLSRNPQSRGTKCVDFTPVGPVCVKVGIHLHIWGIQRWDAMPRTDEWVISTCVGVEQSSRA